MSGRQQINLRVAGQDPEPVVLAAERLDARALRHIPNPNALVLRVGDDEILKFSGQRGTECHQRYASCRPVTPYMNDPEG